MLNQVIVIIFVCVFCIQHLSYLSSESCLFTCSNVESCLLYLCHDVIYKQCWVCRAGSVVRNMTTSIFPGRCFTASTMVAIVVIEHPHWNSPENSLTLSDIKIFFGLSESACLKTYLSQITVQWAQQKCSSIRAKYGKIGTLRKAFEKGGA